ncbi:MAG TPA: GxxExxY protein [Gemmataceae bacterium]|nr:GxxExxY protein [Gemmataceae bacterium]
MRETSLDEINLLTEKIIGAAIEVHRILGPGLLESTYRICLVHELRLQGLNVETEKYLAITYKNLVVENAYRLDLLTEKTVIIELKCVDRLHSVHEAQVISYLKLSGCRVGLLINFNVKLLKDGIKRLVV